MAFAVRAAACRGSRIIVCNSMANSTPPYEWIFSGIGVAVVSWFCAWVYRRYHKVHAAGKQPEQSSQVRISDSTVVGPVAGRDISIGTYVQGEAAQAETSNEEYREAPTTVEIAESLQPVSLYLKESVANSYTGLKVRWRMQLYSIRRLSDGRIDVTLRNEMRVRLWSSTSIWSIIRFLKLSTE